MTYCVYIWLIRVHVDVNKYNAKLSHRKACKGCCCLLLFVTCLLADWSNCIFHIHDDCCCCEVLVCHFEMFAV